MELPDSTATVAEAAATLGVEPGRIAKTLSCRLSDGRVIILLMRGDARLDNQKYKSFFGCKARMLGAEEVESVTGHPVGGVCPFGLKEPFPVYLDSALKDFDTVYPAAGDRHAAVCLPPDRLQDVVSGTWVDIAQDRIH
ncbi:MAG: YbaK/EbsC family protein [Candidatus Baltobacteraceae bacterium]